MKVKIKHLTATSECECCGGCLNSGYVITVNGEQVVARIPNTCCFGGVHYTNDDLISDIATAYRAEFKLDQYEHSHDDVIEYMFGAILSGSMNITIEH